MTLTEGALGDAGELLQQAREALVAAGNASYSDAERAGVAEQLEGIRQQLLAIANRGDGAGGFLFGGQGSSPPPFVDATGGVLFRGTAGEMQVASDEVAAAHDRRHGPRGWHRRPAMACSRRASGRCTPRPAAPGSTPAASPTRGVLRRHVAAGGGRSGRADLPLELRDHRGGTTYTSPRTAPPPARPTCPSSAARRSRSTAWPSPSPGDRAGRRVRGRAGHAVAGRVRHPGPRDAPS